ncbi:MAG: lysyl oxidase family protein [Thermodesulfobacteriota bacterium]
MGPRARGPRQVALAVLAAAFLAVEPAAAGGPDLELDVDKMASTARIDTGIFHPPVPGNELDAEIPLTGTCVLHRDERCAGGPGIRKLLRFEVRIHNRGDEDLILGNPEDHLALYKYSACHHHYHFKSAAQYLLLDESGSIVVRGRKQGFCLRDNLPSGPDSPPTIKYPECEFQGLQVGWADIYPAELDCQWIDITDVPPGDYLLYVAWNPAQLLPETRFDNNVGAVPVTVPPDDTDPPVVAAVEHPSARSLARGGRPLEVRWSARDDVGVVTQEVWLSTDDGRTFRQVVGDLPGDRSSFAFVVPPHVSTPRARIKVVARDASAQKGELTSARFRIVPAELALPRLAR